MSNYPTPTPQEQDEGEAKAGSESSSTGLEISDLNQIVSIPNSSSDDDSEEKTTSTPITVRSTQDSEATLAMLGPIVLNADGTMSRISNWKDMTPREQESAKRLVTRRNETRRQVLIEERSAKAAAEILQEGENEEEGKEDGA